ncbi:MAG TPA: F0F1 ATP synthase subunit delta [Candidatus Methylacidiphilales bacterium]|jgi:F-type H+-transporting ATPase subunit delta|nr:F0F1 ATP synthase subunit delta [Candidatus Methylacidiphilales bacterium]
MKIDRHSRLTAKKVLLAARNGDGSLDDAKVRDLVSAIVEHKPRNYLAILTYLTRLMELAMEENTVRVESATPLADKGASVFAELERRYGPATRTIYEENPKLLGGLKIRRGNNIWDGSLSGRLDRLQQALS